MKKITSIIASLAFTAISFAQMPSGKIVLNKNAKFSTLTISNGTVGMEMMGQNMETLSESTLSSTVEVKDVTPTSYILTSTVNKMKIKTKGGMGPAVDFDSDKKDDMNGELGKTISDEFKPKETEISFSGKPITKGTSSDEDMQKVMQSVMSGSGESGLSSAFILIPSGKKAGDVWLDSTNENGIKISNAYTLQKIDGNEATVVINSLSKINKTTQAQGADVSIVMDSKVTATNIVDITTGIVKEKKMTVEGKGTVGAGGMDIPMTSKVTSTTTIKII